jgi:hypothetical protein
MIIKKAFHSVPHSWVEKSIALLGVNNQTVNFYALLMEMWSTILHVKANQELIQ